MRKVVIGVIGAGDSASDLDVETARRVGELIAREGWIVLTGGRDCGVMGAAADGAKEVAGSVTVGVLPSVDSEVAPSIDVAVFTDMGSGRNNVNVLSSDAVIACGVTGPGTLSEIALALKANKHVIVIGADRVAREFLARFSARFLSFVSSAEEAISAVKEIVRS